jgi:hypothetical protein
LGGLVVCGGCTYGDHGQWILSSEVRDMAVATELGVLKALRERIQELRGYL